MQTSYSTTRAEAFAGMLGDSGPLVTQSFANGEGAGALEYGIGVTYGADPEKEIELPDAGGDVIVGLLAHRHTQDSDLSSTAGLAADQVGDVVKQGRVWVRVEEAVTVGDAVYCRHTASGPNTALGRFRNDADTATASQVTSARWVEGSTAAGLALLEINVP